MTSITTLLARNTASQWPQGRGDASPGPGTAAEPPDSGGGEPAVVFEPGSQQADGASPAAGQEFPYRGRSALAARAYAAQAGSAGSASQPGQGPEDPAAAPPSSSTDQEPGTANSSSASDKSSSTDQKSGAADDGTAQDKSSSPSPKPASASSSRHQLSRSEQLEVAQLKEADTAVRAHEMAHLAAAGPYARSGASYKFQRGPDGNSYAVGGEVQIDASPESDPEETIRKMQVVRQAALAPASPSPQDMKVAARAAATLADASQKLVKLEEAKQEAERAKQAEARSEGQKTSGAAAAGETSQKGAEQPAAAGPPLRSLVKAAAAYRYLGAQSQPGTGLHLQA
ncbi:MAG: putative metalloprotease CJM1_0395 family protein [Desulfobacteraceae bacterium]|nr:putative metalloprotease CJM1_0395 family protein [Desulfobacteraceae bacterium]